jgi:CheY-like chemotaxis protein
MHLVSNAVKFTEAGAVLVKLRAEGPHIEIEVSDTGCGMSAAELLSVFDAFEQADNSLTRAYDGAGLGLTVARGIIEAMDGTLRARSEKGRGATFTATFQAAPAPRPDAISETKPALVPGAVAVPPRILLVEDNLVNREVVKALLRPVTISVVEAENGAEALERLEDGAFDLILMDLHMPVMDGLSAIRAVRALQRPVASTPIVVLTAATSEEDRVRSIDAGADGFLAKPVKARDLAGAVRRFAAGEWRASA